MNNLSTYLGVYVDITLDTTEVLVETYRTCPAHPILKIKDTDMLYCTYCKTALVPHFVSGKEYPQYWHIRPKSISKEDWNRLHPVFFKNDSLYVISAANDFNLRTEVLENDEACLQIDANVILELINSFHLKFTDILEGIEASSLVIAQTVRFGYLQYWN